MKDTFNSQYLPIINAIESHLVGKQDIIKLTLASYFAGGHVLLEDIPGVGKTTLAKRFSEVLGLGFGRIQFTSDMLPSDIIGVSYFSQKDGGFILKRGAIFTQFLLADEINRAMPKTQSALLEAMEENQVTIDGKQYPLPKPFFIIGTQNPHEEVGTFPLPHSQLDRFICSFGIGYPDKNSERKILMGRVDKHINHTESLLSTEDIEKHMTLAKETKLSNAMLDYIQSVIAFTRDSGLFEYGLSTRGALALTSMIKSWAMLHGREYAIPDDLNAVLSAVSLHRLKFREGDTTADRINDEILSSVYADI